MAFQTAIITIKITMLEAPPSIHSQARQWRRRENRTRTPSEKVILVAKDISNGAAGPLFALNKFSIHRWRRQKQALFACNGTRSFRGPKNGVFADVEGNLSDLPRRRHLAVNIQLLQEKARELSHHWVARFLCRARFSLLRLTLVAHSFKKCRISNVLDVTEDDCLWKEASDKESDGSDDSD
ncbi:hypothetical protein ISCGN_018797 [Ixodes scapularis]